jgi:hypothetical protein
VIIHFCLALINTPVKHTLSPSFYTEESRLSLFPQLVSTELGIQIKAVLFFYVVPYCWWSPQFSLFIPFFLANRTSVFFFFFLVIHTPQNDWVTGQ